MKSFVPAETPLAATPAATSTPRRSPAPRASWWLIGVLAVLVALPVAWLQFRSAALRFERDLRREQMRELEVLRAANAKLRLEQASPEDLLRLRADRDALERMRAELEQIKSAAQAASAARTQGVTTPRIPPPPPARSVLEMRNVGTATPAAAAETFVWALQHGNIDAAASLIRFAPDARARMDGILASLPESFRAQYPTPERFLAFIMAGSGGAAALRVLGEKVEGDRAVHLLEVQIGDGRTRHDSILFHREPNGWRRVIPLKTVEAVAAYIGQSPVAAEVQK
ncbi:MAG: hypothetical protein Q7S40_13065 [Opitutaceae bacterium]|nr:hypothetical protein [Opitutaceae bacterium]